MQAFLSIAESGFEKLVLERTPLLDVRAPVEFADGSWPGAVNLPILNDEERHWVGICYKGGGQQEAIRLGHRLVSGEVRAARLNAWAELVAKHPDAVVYCFRGGLRSQTSVRFLREDRGLDVPLIDGGYKALRRFLLGRLEAHSASQPFLTLSGRTGSGKTEILEHLQSTAARVLDLEGLANHRGSAFGRKSGSQPRPADFENRVAAELIRLRARGRERPVILEDESRLIGAVAVPDPLFARLSTSPLVVMDIPLEERVALLLRVYVGRDGRLCDDPDAARTVAEESGREFSANTRALERRLGGARTKECLALIDAGVEEQKRSGRLDAHAGWIAFLLRHYYDPAYDRHINAQSARVVFRGSRDEVGKYLAQVKTAELQG